MEESLYQIVKGCQESDGRCFEIMYGKFLPLLKKYSNRFYDKDDAFDTLLYSLTLCLYQMPINNERFQQEGRIISYISTTLKNCYFALCKEESKRINTVYEYEELKEKCATDEVGIDSEMLLFSLKTYLTESELEIVRLKYCLGYRDAEIAKFQGISRQAVNKKLHKLLNKLKKAYREGKIT